MLAITTSACLDE